MFSQLKKLWVRFRPEKRRYLLIVFFVFLLIGIVRVGTYFITLNIDNRWEEFSERKTMEIIEGVRGAFDDIQRETFEFAQKVGESQRLKELLRRGDAPRGEIFLLLEEMNPDEEFSLELHDKNLSLVAWSGKQAGVDSSELRSALRTGPLSVVSQSALYRYLTVILPSLDDKGKVLGIVAASRLVEVNYPLNNRFLSSSGIERELSKKFGTNVRFEFGADAEASKDGRIVSAELHGLKGNKIGVVHIERPLRSSTLLNTQQMSDSVVSTLVSILPIIILLRFWSNLRQLSPLLQGTLFFLWIWGTRYLWIEFGFPSLLLQGGVFDPTHFASPFGFGLTKSIGDLLITSLFLFVSAFYLLALFLTHARGRKTDGTKLGGVFGLATIFLSGAGIMLLSRGYAEAIRSAVFDSKLRYVDPTTIVPYPLLAAMLFCILLLTLALLLIGVLLFLFSLRMSDRFLVSDRLKKFPSWVIVLVLFAGASLFFGLFHPNPETTDLYRLVLLGVFAIFGLLLLHELETHRRPFTGRSLAAAMLLSIILATPILDSKIHEHDREVLRLYAAELTRPADTWARVILEESLNQMKAELETEPSLAGPDREVTSGMAFRLWARSGLSREGFNSAVGVVRRGRIESLFNLGLQRSEVSAMVGTLRDFSDRRILLARAEGQVRGLDRYIGSVPILSPEGKVWANLVVVIVSGQGMLLRTETPEILQTAPALTLETQFRNLVVSEFQGRFLVKSTGDDFARGHEVPEAAYDALVSGKSPHIWIEEKVGTKYYESVYTLTERETGNQKVLALSMESLDIRWHIFNLLKVAFFYLFIGFTVAAGYLLFAAYRAKKFHLSFRGKLLAALLSLATIPLLVLSYYDREFTNESRMEILRHQAEDELKLVKSNLLNHLGKNLKGNLSIILTDSLCEKLAQETGTDFNVYLGSNVQASSRPELYDAELIDTRLNHMAYRSVMLEGKNFFLQNESIGRYPFLVGYQRLDDEQGRLVGVISVFTGFKHLAVDQELFKRSAFIFGAYAVIMLLVVSIGVFFAFSIGSPIKKLTAAMRRVSRGDLDLSLEVRSKDEIGELVAAFNKMTMDLKRIRKELAAAERELAWREMAKQVAHEIKNPLTPMKLSIQHLQQAYKDRVGDFQTLLGGVSQTIIEQVDSLSRIAAEFSRYARMPERNYAPCDVHTLLRDAIRLFDSQKNIQFVVRFEERNPSVIADEEELRRVFINVLRNAVQAITGKGAIHVTTRLMDAQLEIEISDTGRGIPEGVKERLFEPNFSTKSEGMGLGLAISKQTILDLEGRIEIESAEGKGTRVFIVLPVPPTSEKHP